MSAAKNEANLQPQFTTSIAGLVISLCVFAGSGCAIHYYDPKTGTEHIWGIGHMRMKITEPTEKIRSVISGTNTFGLAAGSTLSESYLSIGWQQLSRYRVLDSDSSVRLEWPSSDLFSVRIGSAFPNDSPGSNDTKDSK
jgi:hypothetical protein